LSLTPELDDYVVVRAGVGIPVGVSLGDNGKVAAIFVILRSLPANTTVSGIPARNVTHPKSTA
jgi:serine acetyltransferase